jgi:uncharacterized coiled-coil protein SlyX
MSEAEGRSDDGLAGNADRFEVLETKLAYQELAVSELGSLVYEYGRRIASLEDAVREMARRLGELDAGKKPVLPANERPPHY